MFRKLTIPFDEIPQFSIRDIAYQNEDKSLRPFYQHSVNIDSFKDVIDSKNDFEYPREVIVQQLLSDYEDKFCSVQTKENIESLALSNSYTIVTAHQPSLLTGPLYFIYKICSALSLCRQLNNHYSGNNFVPTFIMGGEDHDFEEIASVNLFGKKFTWDSTQTGACGRMNTNDLGPVIKEVIGTFGNLPYAQELTDVITKALDNNTTYADFTFDIINHLFGQHGLVIVNMDRKAYKKAVLPYIVNDVQSETSYHTVNEDQEALRQVGFKSQAFAREVNFFMHGEFRDRVVKNDDDTYSIGEESYDQKALLELIQSNPESISPNVVLRPVFQEVVLPNLAYIGGGGELAYWLERKSLFEAFKIPFPMLIRRDSVLLVDQRTTKDLKKMELDINQVFQREEQLIKQYTFAISDNEVSLNEYHDQIAAIFESIAAKSERIDSTLTKTVRSEEAKSKNWLNFFENKLLKAEKRKNETSLSKISKIKQKLFPGNNSLQERHDNFIPFYLKYGHEWVNELIDNLNPIDKGFKVLFLER